MTFAFAYNFLIKVSSTIFLFHDPFITIELLVLILLAVGFSDTIIKSLSGFLLIKSSRKSKSLLESLPINKT